MQAIRTLDGAEWQGRRLGIERARNVKYALFLLPCAVLYSNTLSQCIEAELCRVVLQPS